MADFQIPARADASFFEPIHFPSPGQPQARGQEVWGYYRASLGDFGKGRVRGCAGLAALATAKIHCRRPTFNSQTGSNSTLLRILVANSARAG